MSGFEMSQHAQSRMQQRGLSPLLVDWLMQYGAIEHDHHGAQVYYFDKQSRKNLTQFIGKEIIDRLSSLLDAYLVVSMDGVVITAGHRYKRITRH